MKSLCDLEWSVHLDEAARWAEDDLSDVSGLPERPPVDGWDVLDAGRSIRIPASTYDVAPDYHGVSWWSTEFEVEAGRYLLHFEGVRLLAEVYLDRKRVHVDLEGMTPFSVELPPKIAPGAHRLDLRVTDPGGGNSWLDGDPIVWGEFRLPASHGFGGPWLPVCLEQVGAARVSRVWARANRELRSALVDFDLEAGQRVPLRVEVVGPSGGVAETEIDAGPGHHALVLPLASVAPYRPGQPNLHVCRVLSGDGVLAEARFGLRLLDFEDGTLKLNGEPFRLASAISWGWYRRGPVPSEGDCEREAASAVAFGMNAISAHRHLSTPTLQDALEERGLLLYQEAGGIGTTISPSLSGHQRKQVEELSLLRLRRLTLRDRGRACLAWWNVANEIQAHQLAEHNDFFSAAAAAIRSDDPTRLLTLTSGWGESAMWRPFDDRKQSSWDWHRIYTWPIAWNEVVADEVVRYQPTDAQLAIDGESACFASLGRLRAIAESFDPDAPEEGGRGAWRNWLTVLEDGLLQADPDRLLGGVDAVAEGTARVQGHARARLIEAHRREPRIHGLVTNGWHQHHRVGTSGMVAPDRSPVLDPEPIRRANAERALSFCGLARAARRGDALTWSVELVGPPGLLPEPADADIELELDGRTIWKGHASEQAVASEIGLHTVRASLGDLSVEDVLLVVDSGRPPVGRIAVYEDEPVLRGWLNARGVEVVPWRIRDGLPLLVDGFSVAGGLPEADLPSRVATLHRPFGAGGAPHFFVMGGISLGEPRGDGPAWMDIQGSWVGGWALSATRSLPGLGPPGVWGAERAALYPRVANCRAPGSWLTSAISFPDATMFDIGVPAVGATTWMWERAGHQLLTTTLPLHERRDHPVGEAILMDLVRWLAG